MPTNPLEYKYTSSHEWVSALANDEVTVGITTHAQSMLGDIVFVDLPEVGQVVAKGKEVMVLESVKAAADVYSPVAGEIVAVNESLIDQPEQVVGCMLAYKPTGNIQPIPLHAVSPKPFDWELFARMHGTELT